jgi:hypothetical protein
MGAYINTLILSDLRLCPHSNATVFYLSDSSCEIRLTYGKVINPSIESGDAH